MHDAQPDRYRSEQHHREDDLRYLQICAAHPAGSADLADDAQRAYTGDVMAEKKEQPSQRGCKTSEATEEEPDSPDQDDDFWSQWQPTSVADVKRDTYGSARRRSMVRRLRLPK